MSLDLVNIIFGMKIRQAREAAGLNLSELARLTDLSPSYLTEIEKGRKYPRTDKIMKMAEVLGRDYDELVSIKLHPSLRYLESALSSSLVRRFPFDEFGLEPGDVVTLLTRQPDRASALLHAVLEIGRLHALREEDFFRAALRSYQEIHENYFPELEEAAVSFLTELQKGSPRQASRSLTVSFLEELLKDRYRCTVDHGSLAGIPELRRFRSVLIPGPEPRLLVNGALQPRQIRFLLARELGYRHLGIRERSITSTPHEITSFQQILNDFRAAYFGGALLMPKDSILADLEKFFERSRWDPDQLLGFLSRYDVTPEMLLYRFSELIPQFFGIKLHFLRFQHRAGSGRYRLVKYLNMNHLLMPSGIALKEHFCRRWLSIRLLQQLEGGLGGAPEQTLAGVQLSQFLETQDRFLCIGFARPLVLCPDITSSVVIGFRVEPDLQRVVRFLDDPTIPGDLISETCERCSLSDKECSLRAAEPVILREREQQRAIRILLKRLTSQFENPTTEGPRK